MKETKIDSAPKPDSDKPEIKVVDRRPFTSEGKRREGEPEPPAGEPEPQPPAGEAGSSAAGRPERIEGSGFTMADDPDGTDVRAERSAAFVNLCISLFESGCIHLGVGDHPPGKEPKVDLDAARGAISMLEMLKMKTDGNLSDEESKILESLLAELQMAYVMKAPAASS